MYTPGFCNRDMRCLRPAAPSFREHVPRRRRCRAIASPCSWAPARARLDVELGSPAPGGALLPPLSPIPAAGRGVRKESASACPTHSPSPSSVGSRSSRLLEPYTEAEATQIAHPLARRVAFGPTCRCWRTSGWPCQGQLAPPCHSKLAPPEQVVGAACACQSVRASLPRLR